MDSDEDGGDVLAESHSFSVILVFFFVFGFLRKSAKSSKLLNANVIYIIFHNFRPGLKREIS